MATTISKTVIQSVDTSEVFSDSLTIASTTLPIKEDLIYVDYTVSHNISGVTVTVNDTGLDLIVTISGDHGLDPFNNIIKHFTRGKSDLWEAPTTDNSFGDIDNNTRQVYNWTPDWTPITVTYTINFIDNEIPDSKQFTQTITPDYDPELPHFLNSI